MSGNKIGDLQGKGFADEMAIDQGGGANNPPKIMGILNVTPDSFSDGGKFFGLGETDKNRGERGEDFGMQKGNFLDVDKAVTRGLEMAREGADIIDIGGESTGPGSVDVSVEVELRRVVPVVRGLKAGLLREGFNNVLLSVDTYKSEVAFAVLKEGVDMINDVTALRGDARMAEVLAGYKNVKLILMYCKDKTARTTSASLQYDDVVATIKNFLSERIEFAEKSGIFRERIIIDPGMGAFVSGDPSYSLEILRRLDEFCLMGLPVLVGASRKSFIGAVTGEPAGKRLQGSLACAGVAFMNGAKILRVHDVLETVRFIGMMTAIQNGVAERGKKTDLKIEHEKRI